VSILRMTLVWLLGLDDLPAETHYNLISNSLQIFSSISIFADLIESTKLIKVQMITPTIFSTFPETDEHLSQEYSPECE